MSSSTSEFSTDVPFQLSSENFNLRHTSRKTRVATVLCARTVALLSAQRASPTSFLRARRNTSFSHRVEPSNSSRTSKLSSTLELQNSFISTRFIRTNRVLTSKLPFHIPLHMFDGRSSSSISRMVNLEVQAASNRNFNIPMFVTTLPHGTDCVLGMNFLRAARPIIDWDDGKLLFHISGTSQLGRSTFIFESRTSKYSASTLCCIPTCFGHDTCSSYVVHDRCSSSH